MNICAKISLCFAVLTAILLFAVICFGIDYLAAMLLSWIGFYIFGALGTRAEYVDWMSRAGKRK